MYTLFIIIHVIVSFIMIGMIMLQSGKGSEMGAAFGGAGQTLFGSRGPATFLSKITVGAAIIFMTTSLVLAIMSKERSLLSSVPAPQKQETPSAPQQESSAPKEEVPTAQSSETPATEKTEPASSNDEPGH